MTPLMDFLLLTVALCAIFAVLGMLATAIERYSRFRNIRSNYNRIAKNATRD